MTNTGAARLRELLADESNIVVAPGVYDGITARLALSSGAKCLYVTGAGTSMSRLGMADLGLATFNDMHATAAMVASLDPAVPVIADIDTGYGGPLNVARTVRAYARAGVAAVHVEDQVQEKRCGHLTGKLVVGRDVFASRLRAACRARDEAGGGMLVIARTDARAGREADGGGGTLDEAVARLRMAADVGVDGLFCEALRSVDEMRAVVRACPPGVPLLLNNVQGGLTPVQTADEARALGFRIAIWPCLGMEAVIPAYRRALEVLNRTGKAPEDQAMGPAALFEVCGLKELLEFDREVAGGNV